MKIIYTDSAKVELERFHKERQDQLESLIKQEKYVFGDDIVEITASDLREAEKRFYIREKRSPRLPMVRLLLKSYFILGIISAIVGIFYERIMELLRGNPIQRMLILVGIAVSLAAIIGNYYLRVRQDARDEQEKRFREYEEKLPKKHE